MWEWDMCKKIIGTIVGILILTICSTGSFADLTIEFDDDSSLMLIEPNVGSENQIMLRDSLTISIRPQDEPTVKIGLRKIMPSCIDDELEDFIDEVCDEYNSMEYREIGQSEEDMSGEIEQLEEADDDSSENREEIVFNFSKLTSDFKDNVEEFKLFRDDIQEILFDDVDDAEYYTKEQIDLIEQYKIALGDIVREIEEFKKHEEDYVSLFNTQMFEPELIAPVGVLPYYHKTIEDILSGYYQLEFIDVDTDDVIEVIEFEVIDKDLITEENIKDVVDDYMKPLQKSLVE